ncbi:MAG: dTMP kinase [Actinomycetia bacterium]|nr:dTMP kinase [Actinomycetes bacterium]
MTARWIAFEGGDASGKSTQARLLADHLDAVLTLEPGGTELGQAIRSLVLDPRWAPVDDRAEALLYAADRAQHLAEVVLPALEAGRHVISDRSVASSLAYQGGGRGLGVDEIGQLNDWATGGRRPDVYLFLVVEGEVATERLGDDLDRLEQAGDEFHRRVDATFRELADGSADWVLVDGHGTIDEVAARVRSALEPILRS